MKIAVCGDISPSKCSELFEKTDAEKLFGDVPAIFSECDRVLVNIECALTYADTPINKRGPNLKATPKTAEVLSKVGVTDAGISNNHIFDYGVKGVEDTMAALRSAGINYTGFGKDYNDSRKNLIIEKDGVKIAVIAVCEHEYSFALESRMGARPFDVFDTPLDVRRAKEECDYVIVTYHGGKEQSIYPSPRLVKACRAMIECGADAVLCQHSHCIGCYEEYKGGHILYGQGNFHFTAYSTHPHWQSGLGVIFDTDAGFKPNFFPVKVNGAAIELAKGDDYDSIMQAFSEQNENLRNGKWIDYWNDFCISTKERYLGNISRAFSDKAEEHDNELFCGRMHCEAHKDVIDWLCKHYWEVRGFEN